MDKRLETSIRTRSAELYATMIDGEPKGVPTEPQAATLNPSQPQPMVDDSGKVPLEVRQESPTRALAALQAALDEAREAEGALEESKLAIEAPTQP